MNSILIVLLGALGDVIRGFSILPPIKHRYPNVKITWLVEPACKGIVALHTLVDEILVFDRGNPITGLIDLKKELDKRNFDITLDLQRHFKSGFFSWISKSPKRIGFNRSNAKEFNWIFNNHYIPEVSNSVSKVYHYQEFVKELGIELNKHDNPVIDFGLTVPKDSLPHDLNQYLANDSSKFNIGIVLGSQWYTKDWPEEGYRKLIDLYQSNFSNSNIILLGDKTKETMGVNLKNNFKQQNVFNTVGKTTLKELLGIINICQVVVGPDSGPGHMASALKIPYISLFGPTTPERVAPFGNEHLVIQSKIGCAGCMQRTCPVLDKICMRFISPNEVFHLTTTVLTGN
jgi:heptosyltransferase I